MIHKERDVKRSRKAARTQNGTNGERADQQDGSEVACLERLSEELEHPSRSRREGARAALRCLNRLVALRAAAGVSREDAWIQMFDTEQPLLGGFETQPVEPSTPRSVEQIVQDIERELANRERPDVLN
jgi:hypothetical protein